MALSENLICTENFESQEISLCGLIIFGSQSFFKGGINMVDSLLLQTQQSLIYLASSRPETAQRRTLNV